MGGYTCQFHTSCTWEGQCREFQTQRAKRNIYQLEDLHTQKFKVYYTLGLPLFFSTYLVVTFWVE